MWGVDAFVRPAGEARVEILTTPEQVGAGGWGCPAFICQHSHEGAHSWRTCAGGIPDRRSLWVYVRDLP